MTLPFSPYKKISEVPLRTVQRALIWIFKVWGVPGWFKVDNGRPFGDPQMELVPPLALWLIGLGIRVVWNRPATPTDNAKVERSQGVMGKWTEYAKCPDTPGLQDRLWKEAEFHNLHFPVRRKKNRKRIELFPRLLHTGREWSPGDFELERVLAFLATGHWERKVSSNGQVSIYGQRFSVGVRHKHQVISLKLDPVKNCWNIYDAGGGPIKEQPSPFSEKNIWALDLS